MTNHVITIDFETYYDTEYTLTKMPTQAYVHDNRFEVIGYGVQLDHEEPIWYPSLSTPPYSTLRDLPWDDSVCVAHNAQFDGYILAYYCGIHPKRFFCTMMGAKPLFGPKLGTVSLKAISDDLGIGMKGTEVHDAKGKHLRDFTYEELAAYGEYCKNDVRLTYILYQILDAWYERKGQ